MERKYNQQLKGITTYDELNKLIEDAKNDGYELQMRRSGFTPFHFVSKPGDRVSYLIDDGISTGNSMIKNLHRNMIFK